MRAGAALAIAVDGRAGEARGGGERAVPGGETAVRLRRLPGCGGLPRGVLENVERVA